MGKIRSLLKMKLPASGQGLLKIYLERFGRVFTPVTYLGAYEDLRDMILSGLSGELGATQF